MNLELKRKLTLASLSPVILESTFEESGVESIILAAVAKPLNRYSFRVGKIYGKLPGKDRYKILDISGDSIVYRDVLKFKVEYAKIDDLLKAWNSAGVVEISNWDEVLEIIKKYLSPLLGSFLAGILITWLLEKLGK